MDMVFGNKFVKEDSTAAKVEQLVGPYHSLARDTDALARLDDVDSGLLA
jgi:hypothetical protein